MNQTIETLRREAKRLSRATTITHMQALDVLAVQKGFTHWSALTQRIGIEKPSRSTLEMGDMRAVLKHILQRPMPDLAGSRHLIISGGVAAGKTSLVSKMVAMLPEGTTISAIEDVREIVLPDTAVIRTVSRTDPPTNDVDMLADALAEDPDVLIIGEVCTPNAAAIIDAMGMNDGPIIVSTVHATTAVEAVEIVARRAGNTRPGLRLPVGVAIVHIERDILTGGRRISGRYIT